jgi:hypothetical protein
MIVPEGRRDAGGRDAERWTEVRDRRLPYGATGHKRGRRWAGR